MAQSEFRIGKNGQKQKLNDNRRWENVDDNAQKASQNSPSGTLSAVQSDFSSRHSGGDNLTAEQKDHKQQEASREFVNFLLDEGISPYHFAEDYSSEGVDEIISDYVDSPGVYGRKKPEPSDYYHIIKEMEDHKGFSRAHHSLIEEQSRKDKEQYDRLTENAYQDAEYPALITETDPDLEFSWKDAMMTGDYRGTLEDFYQSDEAYTEMDNLAEIQQEQASDLIDEWRTRNEKEGFDSDYVLIESNNTGWNNRKVTSVIPIDEINGRNAAFPRFVPQAQELRCEWIQDKGGKTLNLNAYHHDSPTGENWKITPLSQKEVEELEIEDY